jgi:hypothetical protein
LIFWVISSCYYFSYESSIGSSSADLTGVASDYIYGDVFATIKFEKSPSEGGAFVCSSGIEIGSYVLS